MNNMNSHDVNPDTGLHIIFVDSEVDNYQDLIAGCEAEIVLLDSDRDGIEQITETLAQSSNVSTVEILSHGRANSIDLGNSQLNADNIEQYRTEIASWSAALTENSDILIHGCNVAGVDGSDLITQLGDLTSADIAASNDVTGSNAAGGDWELEVVTGEIESQTGLNPEGMSNYDSLLLTYNDSEYQLTSPGLTWLEAQAEAESLGGNLVSINDAAEQQWIVDNLAISAPRWIGFSDRNTEGQFEWSDGSTVDYTNWRVNQPDDSGSGEDYGVISSRSDGGWNDVGDSGRYRGIVEINNADTEPNPELPDPTQTYFNNGSEYRLTSTATTWEQAQNEAEAAGGNLITINDVIEKQWISQTFGTDRPYWTGLSDRNSEGEFTWVSGEDSAYRNWQPNQPNNSTSGEDYTVINSTPGDDRWDDVTNNENFYGIIEIQRSSGAISLAGDGALEVWANEAEGNTQDVFQRIYQANGSSRDVEAGGFTYFEPHGHSHFDEFVLFNLREVNPDGSIGEVVASGDSKYSFCLLNIRQPFPELTENAIIADGRGGTSCGDDVQGISVGYSDVYNSNLENQWIITPLFLCIKNKLMKHIC